MTSAETAYLFRHALVRDAAYQLHTPGDREILHELAFYLIEEAFGGRAPEPAPLDTHERVPWTPHSTDIVAGELATHAESAQATNRPNQELASLRRLYVRRAAEYWTRNHAVETAVQQWLSLAKMCDGPAAGEALRRAAIELAQVGRLQHAEPLLNQALAIHEAGGDRWMEALVLSNLGLVYEQTRRPELATRTLERALALNREVGNRRGEGSALGNLANSHLSGGRMPQALAAYQASVQILEDVGDRDGAGTSLLGLAQAFRIAGKPDEAERVCLGALSAVQDAGNRRTAAVTRAVLADVYAGTGRKQEAEQLYSGALAEIRELGLRRQQASVTANLATLYQSSGQLDLAEATNLRVLEMLRETDAAPVRDLVLSNLGAIRLERGDFVTAEKTVAEALESHRGTGNRRAEGISLMLLGKLYLETDRPGPARHALDTALELCRSVGNKRSEAEVLSLIAALHEIDGDWQIAEQLHSSAIAILHEVRHLESACAATCQLGLMYLTAGRPEQAEHALAQAQELAARTGSRANRGLQLCCAALFELFCARPLQAREKWQSGCGLLREVQAGRALHSVIGAMFRLCAAHGLSPLEKAAL